MSLRSGAVLIVVLAIALTACGGDQEPSSSEAGTTATTEAEAQEETQETEAEASPLVAVCKKAFGLIEENEPGTVPRKKAVALANEAFFIDDSPQTNEAFSNLNNVYVYDDGSSSPEEVQSQLEAVCP